MERDYHDREWGVPAADERALFYMRSRGVPEAEARALLIEAFLAETIPDGLPEALRDELVAAMQTWLATGKPPAPAATDEEGMA